MTVSAPNTDFDRSLVRLRIRDDATFVSHGDTVFAPDEEGFVEPRPDIGLFVHQTRLVSLYRLRLGGRRPLLVSGSSVTQDRWLGYYILAATGPAEERGSPQSASQQTLELRLARTVGEGMHEDYDLTNWTQEPLQVRMTLEVDGDFADLDETIKGERQQNGELRRDWKRVGDNWELRFDYRVRRRYSQQRERGTASLHRALVMRIANADSPPRRRGRFIHFDLELPPKGKWHACLEWVPEVEGETLRPPDCAAGVHDQINRGGSARDGTERRFLKEASGFSSGESETLAPVVVDALKQARRDLLSLRLPRFDHGQRGWVTAAGVPMFVGLFGRDALQTAIQAAPLGPELLRGTLVELERWQGRVDNAWRDEQPGRILHEAHTGPLKVLNYLPKARYYGTLTAATLFPAAVAVLWQWSGDREAVAPLLDPALRALRWLETCRQEDHGVFYAVRTRSRQGISNQTWKDSDDSIVYEDGTTAPQPVATCEEQGLVYAAKLGMAGVLAAFDRRDEARRLAAEASEFRKRFNERYWMEEEGCFAMAIDPDQRQVRSIGSNALHTLSTGIADEALVPRLLQRLCEPDMYNGWGIRTLSSKHRAYNPYAYHRGTVWPVEHGPFAMGAYRYGMHDRVDQIARGMFELASLFDYRRLPECIAGHPRNQEHPFPALYPSANAPQAWSAATVVSLMQAMLGLQPFAASGLLLVDPHLPEWLPTITVHHLRVGEAAVSLRFDRQPDGRTNHEVLEIQGELQVLRAPSPWSLVLSAGVGLKRKLAAIQDLA